MPPAWPDQGPGEPARASRFLRAPFLWVGWLVGCKALLLARSGLPLGGAWLRCVAADLVLGSLLALASVLLLSRRSRPWRAGALGLLAVLAGLQYVAAAYQWKTGGLLDFSLLHFAWEERGDLHGAIGSEIFWFDWLAMLSPCLLLALRPWRRPGPARSLPTLGALAFLLAAGAACQGMAARGAEPRLRVALLRPLLPLPVSRPAAITGDWRAYLPPPFTRREHWQQRPAAAPRPNVIVIVLEAVRAASTSVYPPHLGTTPFLAALAKQALVFDEAYALVPHTSKSLLGIFAGHPPELHKDISEPGRLPETALPELLAELGYRTAFFQSATEFFEDRRALVESLGFEEFYAAESLARPGFGKSNYLGIEDRALVAPVLSWVARQRERPFFLGLLTVTSHHDYTVPPSWGKRTFPGAPVVPAAAQHADYLSCISYTDDVLRELFTGLEQTGRLADTVVFVLGDHGEGFGEHGELKHDEVLWQEGIHIPLLVLGPQRLVGAPRRIAGKRQVIDILPTVEDLLAVPGAKLPRAPALGMSLLADPPADRTLWLSSNYENRRLGMLRGPYKYLDDMIFDRLLVFDLAADPGELRPLDASQEEASGHPLVQEMRRWRASVFDWYREADARRAAAERQVPDLPAPVVAGLGSGMRLVGSAVPAVARAGDLIDVELVLAVEEPPAELLEVVVVARQLGRGQRLASFRETLQLDLRQRPAGSRVHVHGRFELAPHGLVVGPTRLEVGLADARGELLAVRLEQGTVTLDEPGLVPLGELQILPVAR